MLHNLCRYILYVCRYIAQYISMANESNLKRRSEKISGQGTYSCIVFRFEIPRANRPCLLGKVRGTRRSRKERSRLAAKSCRSRSFLVSIKEKPQLSSAFDISREFIAATNQNCIA